MSHDKYMARVRVMICLEATHDPGHLDKAAYWMVKFSQKTK